MTEQSDNTSPKIQLAHGSGGRLSQELFEAVFQPAFSNSHLNQVHDGAILTLPSSKIAFSTDSYVVNPLFFPGGNIGDLAVNGTVNDLSMCGARPLYLSAGFILEEGFPIDALQKIVQSMKVAAEKAGVKIVTGDTKVVEHGKADGVFVNTAGVGVLYEGAMISPRNLQPGDVILINGKIAAHGIAILSKREGLDFEVDVQSDSAALNGVVEAIYKVTDKVHVLRDPTRGGVSATLNEIAAASNLGILLEEERIPMDEAVRVASDLLGLDPLYIANEGKMLVVVPKERAESVLTAMRSVPEGADSAIIGRVVEEHPKRVVLVTPIGTKRIIDMPTGEQLPRIC